MVVADNNINTGDIITYDTDNDDEQLWFVKPQPGTDLYTIQSYAGTDSDKNVFGFPSPLVDPSEWKAGLPIFWDIEAWVFKIESGPSSWPDDAVRIWMFDDVGSDPTYCLSIESNNVISPMVILATKDDNDDKQQWSLYADDSSSSENDGSSSSGGDDDAAEPSIKRKAAKLKARRRARRVSAKSSRKAPV